MKNSKFAIIAAAGLLAVSAASTQAAVQGVPITLSVTVNSSSSVTNPDTGAVTFTAASSTLNNAGILAKVSDTLGIVLPAGAHLGVSIIEDDVNNIDIGDVVILGAGSQIIWNLNDVETPTGSVEIELGLNGGQEEDIDVFLTTSARLSKTVQFKALGFVDLFFEKTEPVEETVVKSKVALNAGDEDNFEFFDLAATGAFTQGNSGTQMTTGSINMAGAGELDHFDFASDTDTYFPCDVAATGSGGPVPANNFPFFNNFFDDN